MRKYQYKITVKQYQMFDFETNDPIDEDTFWNDIYHLGSDVDIDSSIVEWEETVEPSTIVQVVEKKGSPDNEYLRKGLDVALELLSDRDLEEWNARMEEE